MTSLPHALMLALFLPALYAVLARGDWFARHVRHATAVRLSTIAAAAVLVPANVYAMSLAVGSTVAFGVASTSLTALIALVGAVALLRITDAKAAHPRRVLAIGAHPDDLELACGGTLAKLVDNGHEVHAMVMSRGNIGGDQLERMSEARRAASFIGATSVTVHDFPDTALQEASQGMVAAMEIAISRVEPDIILTHSAHDQHQDHAAVHTAALRAARQHSSILCFESPSVTREFNPSVFVDIADHIGIKVEAVKLHRDQTGKGKAYMSPQRLRGLATFRGAQAKRQFAEGYEAVRLLGSAVGDM
ncbi:PIG-L family deacetylase [Georgenia halophila]|uniref:PIG-L family deacetylase n=1 Tax=Georgenia halophila TaxID=620889 RepID=A0ABP8L2Z4_9MICO